MPPNRRVGIMTAGGDSPGLNAAIRGFGKAAHRRYGMEVVGFRDGFRGLAEDPGSSSTPGRWPGS